jgi:hypothetical protein
MNEGVLSSFFIRIRSELFLTEFEQLKSEAYKIIEDKATEKVIIIGKGFISICHKSEAKYNNVEYIGKDKLVDELSKPRYVFYNFPAPENMDIVDATLEEEAKSNEYILRIHGETLVFPCMIGAIIDPLHHEATSETALQIILRHIDDKFLNILLRPM